MKYNTFALYGKRNGRSIKVEDKKVYLSYVAENNYDYKSANSLQCLP